MRLILILLISVGLNIDCSAQAVFFEKVFGTPATELGRSVRQINSGSIFVLGYSNIGPSGDIDISLSKLDKSGNLLWMKYYGDAQNNFGLGLNLCLDGNLIISGETETLGNGVDALACKVDTNGNQLWFKTFGDYKNQSFRYIEQTKDSGYIACGFTTDFSNSNDFYVMKLDAQGNQSWVGNYGGSFNDVSYMIRQIASGNFVVIGDTNSDGAGSYDAEVIELDSIGNVVWVGYYGDSLVNGSQGILPLKNGGYAIYGETEIAPNSAFDFFIQKLDSVGNNLWRHTFGGAVSDALFSLVENNDGSFVFTGYSNSYAPGPLNLVVGKTDSLANLEWIRIYGDSSGIDIGYQIIPAQDTGYLIVGNTYQNGSDDFYLLHVNDSGRVIGLKEYERSKTNLSIYPNPSNGIFKLNSEFKTGTTLLLKLFSPEGKCILNKWIPVTVNNSIEVSLPNSINAGFYFLYLANNNYNRYAKICIQK
jgi:Secretion system C-terminal sorting domain